MKIPLKKGTMPVMRKSIFRQCVSDISPDGVRLNYEKYRFRIITLLTMVADIFSVYYIHIKHLDEDILDV